MFLKGSGEEHRSAIATISPEDGFGTPDNNPKKRRHQESPLADRSPGSVLDDFEGGPILDLAIKTYDSYLSLLDIPGLPFRAPSLGRFSLGEMGHTQNQIDARFHCAALPNLTPAGQALSKKLEKKDGHNHILLGVSGCGKTSAIFDAARKSYCILIAASNPDKDEGMATYRDLGGLDTSFTTLVDDLKAILNGTIIDREKEWECDRAIDAFIVARMMILYAFHEKVGTNKEAPLLWLVYQLSDQLSLMTLYLYPALKRRERKTVGTLRTEIESRMDFFFAFDEAQEAYKALDTGFWHSSKDKTKTRGMGSPFLRRLALSNKSVIVAGTALSLGGAVSCRSDLGKPQQTHAMCDFPMVSLEEIPEKLNQALNLEGVSLENVPSLWMLVGRGRLFGGLFLKLAQVEEEHPSLSKEEVLDMAIKAHYQGLLQGLVKRIKESFPDAQDPLMLKEQLPASIAKLAIAALWGGTVSFAVGEFDEDLLNVGLCSVKKVDRGFILDEELGKQAILKVAAANDAFVTAFENVACFCDGSSAPSSAMEPLLVGELFSWCSREENKNATVKDFLDQMFTTDELPPDLPDWIDTAPFVVRGGFSRNNYALKEMKNDVNFVTRAIKRPEFRNLLLSPSIVKRPDFESVMNGKTQHGPEQLWFFSISSKLYSSIYDDNSQNDLRSSDPKYFFRKKDGHDNPQCANLRRDWEAVLREHEAMFKRCLRVHLCLPDVQLKDKVSERIWVEADKSIVAYITEANVRKLMKQSTINQLTLHGYLREPL